MEEFSLVTVAIPVYNAEKYIALAISSVLSQTYKNFELIITDDGSDDNTLAIIELFNDSRIKLFSDGENRGISFRLNQQIDLAKGKYFVRMDADDIMFPDRLKCQISFLESHLDIDVIGASAIVIDENNKIIGKREFKEGRIKSFIHPTISGRLEWFKKYKYRNEYKGSEDFELWVRSSRYSKMHNFTEPLLFYRDPLCFNIKTYRFRQKQTRCICRYYMQKNKSNIDFFLRLYVRSFLMDAVALIFSFLKCDKFIISKRNISIPLSDMDRYKEILANIIDDVHN